MDKAICTDDYISIREAGLKKIEHAYRLANQLRYAIRNIQVPIEGLIPPEIHMYLDPGRIVVWLHNWPMEAGCGFVAELEELLLTSSEVVIESNSHIVESIFLRNTPFEFKVYCSPTNCVWEGTPQVWEFKESTEKPRC